MKPIQFHKYPNVWAEYVSQLYMSTGVPETLTISPNLRRFAYACKEEGQEEYVVAGGLEGRFRDNEFGYVVIDGQESDLYDAIIKDSLVFSANSRRFACVAQENGKLLVVTDTGHGAPYDGMLKEGPQFSPDGSHLAYAAAKDNRWFVVYDGRELDAFAKVDEVSFSPDGQHLAYTAKENGKALLIQDGKCVGKYDRVLLPTFSPDSRRLAYLAVRGGESFVVVDGVPGPRFDGLLLGDVAVHPYTLETTMKGKLVFSPDSQHIAYGAQVARKQAAFRDQKEEIRCDAVVGAFAFSPDSRHLLYVAGNAGRQFIVLDGQPQRRYENLVLSGNEVFSPDSSHIACVAKIGDKRCVVVDDQEGTKFDGIKVRTVAFSPDSKRSVYLARNKDTVFAVLDGRVLSDYPNPTYAAFSSDSTHLAFDTQIGATQRLMMDTEELFACDFIYTLGGGRIQFETETTIRFMGCIIGAVYSIVCSTEERDTSSSRGAADAPRWSLPRLKWPKRNP